MEKASVKEKNKVAGHSLDRLTEKEGFESAEWS